MEVASPQETQDHTDNRLGAVAHFHKKKKMMMMMANGSSEAHEWSVSFGSEEILFLTKAFIKVSCYAKHRTDKMADKWKTLNSK